jgi:hypothetical protein
LDRGSLKSVERALPAEVRKEFSYNARRLVTFALTLLEVAHAFACLLWLVLRVQHFPEGGWSGVITQGRKGMQPPPPCQFLQPAQ